jgi:hypothetical protein
MNPKGDIINVTRHRNLAQKGIIRPAAAPAQIGLPADYVASRAFSLTADWQQLPDDIKAHLIQHPAQPSKNEVAQIYSTISRLLPTYNGTRQGLPLNRNAPSWFEMVD